MRSAAASEAGGTIAGKGRGSTRADVISRRLDRRKAAGYETLHNPNAGTTDVSTQTSALPRAAGQAQHSALIAAVAIAAVAAATIAGAWFFQLVLDIVPCPMCLEQRWAYYGIIPLAILIAIGAKAGTPRGVLLAGLALIALAALCNAGYGAYHAGVEWKFWPGPTSCTGASLNLGGGSLLDQLDKVKVVPCDVVQWRFLGISLAGYNALISLLMAALAAWGITRRD
jgi:disulfide bond formation protein DsbB